MLGFIDLYRVDRRRDRGDAEPDEVDRAGRAWYTAAGGRDTLRVRMALTELPGLERQCVVCGREGEPIVVYGHAPAVIIAGSATPEPPTMVFCSRCVHDHRLGPGVSVAEELVNAWRAANGLPERDFSRF